MQEAVEAGQIAPRTAYELTKIDDPAEQAEAAREAAAGRLKRDELAERTRRPREGREDRPRAWSFATERVKVVVSATADDVSEEELTEAIAAALKERRGRAGAMRPESMGEAGRFPRSSPGSPTRRADALTLPHAYSRPSGTRTTRRPAGGR